MCFKSMLLTPREAELLLDVLNSHTEAFDNDDPEDRPKEYPEWQAVYERLLEAHTG